VLPELTEFLSEDERRAADEMGSPARQEAFVAGRALLRLLAVRPRPLARPPEVADRPRDDRPSGAPDANVASSEESWPSLAPTSSTSARTSSSWAGVRAASSSGPHASSTDGADCPSPL
jgi:hypothetical protein